MKKIVILGSTGMIGKKSLIIAKQLKYKIIGFSAGENIKLIEKQIKEFKPKFVSVKKEKTAKALKKKFKIPIYSGLNGLIELTKMSEVDIIVNALSGSIGLLPTIEAIKKRKEIALANKDSLVMAGPLIMQLVKKNNINLMPVDSEHSAIHQCLKGEKNKEIKEIIITASGGPFLKYSAAKLKRATLSQALSHPTWKMGARNTIDSATLMNKGFEVLGIHYLFDIELSKIKTIIHPQSIIHSMVRFIDGSVKAQLSSKDMSLPIRYALTYPKRTENNLQLDLSKTKILTFEKVNQRLFPCLNLAYQAGKIGHSMPIVLNAANEIAVDYFLSKKINFNEIPKIINKAMQTHKIIKNPNLQNIFKIDKKTKEQIIKRLSK